MLRLGLAFVLSLILLAPPARATTIHGPADVASLARASDAVVRAQVLARESRFAEGGEASGQVFTFVELELSEVWKSAPARGSAGPRSPLSPRTRIWVRMPGGSAGSISQQVAGTPAFRAHEEVIVFLRRRAPAAGTHPAVFEVSHWALGKFSVSATSGNAGVAPRASRDRSGVECVGCKADERDVLPLDELRAEVAAAQEVTP